MVIFNSTLLNYQRVYRFDTISRNLSFGVAHAPRNGDIYELRLAMSSKSTCGRPKMRQIVSERKSMVDFHMSVKLLEGNILQIYHMCTVCLTKKMEE